MFIVEKEITEESDFVRKYMIYVSHIDSIR